MDTSTIISTLYESLFVILVFLGFLSYALIRGRQTLINVILGLYLALLISLKFPYYDLFLKQTTSAKSEAIMMIVIFGAFAFASTLLFNKLMPREYDERIFEGFGKKLIFAVIGTALVMAYSYHALPITDLVDPGSPVQKLFGSEDSFFLWLAAPLIILMFLG